MRSLFLTASLILAFGSSCREDHKATQEDRAQDRPGQQDPAPTEEPKTDGPDLSLTIPAADRVQSNFCGQVTPALPEDPTPAYQFDANLIDGKLKGDGLVGWMHGVVPQYNHFIFTYRLEDRTDPMAFFKAQQFTLVPRNEEVAKQLVGLHRHDKVRLKGSFFDNHSPLPHLNITSIEMIEAYPDSTDNDYMFDISKLNGKKKLEVFGQVHAKVYSEKLGYGLVIEHNDMMLPVAVAPEHAAVAEKIFRSDIVNIALKVVEHPHSPPHFETDTERSDAIQVVDPILNCHGVERTLEGFLVKFNKSPAINSDTYGIRIVDANGIGRNFTFFPSDEIDDMDEWMKIFFDSSAKAKAVWDESSEEPQVVRNYFKKEGIKVTVKGKMNAVSSEQANPQIYIRNIDDLVIEQK